MTRARLLLLVGVAAVLIAGVLIGVSVLVVGSDDDGGGGGRSQLQGAAETQRLLAGVPQNGVLLGRPKAPVTLVEFADLQCPYCRDWNRQTLPVLVEEYVRTGKLRIVFGGVAFIGPDSEAGLRAALAAGEQNRLWNVVDLLYRHQGAENGGWVTEELVRKAGSSVPGLDVDEMLARRDSAAVSGEIAAIAQAASRAGVSGTPSFGIGPTGQALQPLRVSALGPAQFRAAIDDRLGR